MATKLKDRPARTYRTGAVTRALRYVSLAGVGALCLFVAFTYGDLPDTVPTHFGFSGEADAWGAKSTVWVLMGVNVLMVGLLAWLSTNPRWFNYPSDITKDNAQYLYREGERMMVWLSVALMVLSYGVILSIYDIDSPLLVLCLIALPAITITALIRVSFAGDKKSESAELEQSTADWSRWLK